MKRLLVFIMALTLMIFADVAGAAVAWEENFDPIKATWVETTATWTDLAGSTAKLTESDPGNTYGVAASEIITVDVGQYSELVIVSTAIDAGTLYSVQIQNADDPNEYNDAVSYVAIPGTQIVNIADLMGWSGIKSFVINVWIDGESSSATFDLLQIREPDGWTEDFNPIKSTWTETTAVWTDLAGPTAKLTESDPGNTYGFAQSEVITIDVDTYNELVITSTAVDAGTYYSVQIQEIGGAGDYNDAVSYMGAPATHVVDIAALMGWSGIKSFVINIWIDGESKGATFDLLQIRRPTPISWQDHFDPIKSTWSEVGAYWTDTPDSNAILTEDNPGFSYGKVESETLVVDLDVYPELTVVVTDVEASGHVDIGIQEQGGGWAYSDVVPTIYGPNGLNSFTVDIASAMGWSGYQSFRIIFWINGNTKSATFDMVQLAMNCGTDVLAGDFYEDCVVDFKDFAFIADSWLNGYGMVELKDITDYWLVEQY